MIEVPYDKEHMAQINEMVRFDTAFVNPESCVDEECPHQAIRYNEKYPTAHDVDFNGNIATRYYEDNTYARAYALSPYENGLAIIADKKDKSYTIFVLGEDDGVWFISDTYRLYWVQAKSNFMALLYEVISVFNNNYKEKE